ncbi:PAAR domain-containing protein [Aggregatibacter actinomycetemcomitans]|uniref:PAAR domain-containing protein n=1 Tax=Aggregatibacter actinomycetemcomitans TaxID=714 RepID=UPI00197B1ACD|nr:PAAR domain-containing protein [Aggregatibacter actinomycetemcomitans]MBN6076944.1 PAAR domain-containing protein [Aggregatibacter actinomycetemcomitans]MBN6077021.1 PAAR domain-containing protein [Aggregatibacter actinomycetemcomitans]MBN6077117.1 PAAR domain-containing protein [Aggregatibacter actinomycetemcomitans]MBN6077869.1 PAAR domain-containing protein [Aggregatibacter actinomycetemcomitans]
MFTKNPFTHQTTETHLQEQSQRKPVYSWLITPKGKKPAYVGDSVVHPDGSVGKIVSGQSNVSYGKKQAACVGDKVQCPGHEGVILQGAKSISIGGKAMAREGDKTSCGGVIMSGFATITAYDNTKTVHGKTSEENNREIQIALMHSSDAQASNAYIGIPYKILVNGSEIGNGLSDDNAMVHAQLPEDIKEFELQLANGRSYIVAMQESEK